MGTGSSGLYTMPKPLVEAEHLMEMEAKKVKFNLEEVVMTAKDTNENLVWLEKGNENKGLEHILNGSKTSPGHKEDFQNAFGVSESNIPRFMKNVISNGNIVSEQKVSLPKGGQGIERIYYVDGKHYLLTGVGTNGFIVTSYPVEIKIRRN